MSNYTCQRLGLPIPTWACSEIPCSTILKTRPSCFIDVSWIFVIPVHEATRVHYCALFLHENWMQFLKQLPAVNCFWSPHKECYQGANRWVSVLLCCSASQHSQAKYYQSQPHAQLHYTKTLKLKPPTCFDPCRIIIREYTHQIIMYKALQRWKHVGVF
jgi:hypothetical protein